MTLILIFIVNFAVFIIAMIGMLAAYFEQKWKWFFPILLCVILSGICVFLELSQWLMPLPPHESPIVIRQPTTPL